MAERPNFSDRSRWEVFPNIKVFAEHARTARGKNGKKRTVSFTREKLDRIAEKSNRRDEIGQWCPLMLGHTEDGKPETDQPDIVGYARHFKVGYDKTLGKHVVTATYYLRKEDAAEAKRYPRTSVEVWADDEFFDPISLLKRTPQLDLGQWTYGKGGGLKLRYSMDDLELDDRDGGRDMPPPAEGDDGGDGGDMPPAEDDGGGGGTGPEDVDPDFHGQFMKCMAHYEMGKKAKMGAGLGDGGDVPPARKPMPVPMPKKPDEQERMRKDSESLRFARMEKMVADMRKESRAAIEGLRAENQNLRYDREAAVCERVVSELEAQGYHLDREVEVERMVDMDEAAREKHVRYVKRVYSKAPVHDVEKLQRLAASPPVRMSRSTQNGETRVTARGGSNGRQPHADDVPDADETELVIAYVRENGLSGESGWNEALKAVRGGRS
jgi:hypothetical protein